MPGEVPAFRGIVLPLRSRRHGQCCYLAKRPEPIVGPGRALPSLAGRHLTHPRSTTHMGLTSTAERQVGRRQADEARKAGLLQPWVREDLGRNGSNMKT